MASNTNYSALIRAPKILAYFGIDINDTENRVFLPHNLNDISNNTGGAYQREIHTEKYFNDVLKRLELARSQDQAIEILDGIRNELSLNQFPYESLGRV